MPYPTTLRKLLLEQVDFATADEGRRAECRLEYRDQLVFELVRQPTGGEFTFDTQTGAFTYASGPRDDERVELSFRVGDGEEWSRTERVRIRSRNK